MNLKKKNNDSIVLVHWALLAWQMDPQPNILLGLPPHSLQELRLCIFSHPGAVSAITQI